MPDQHKASQAETDKAQKRLLRTKNLLFGNFGGCFTVTIYYQPTRTLKSKFAGISALQFFEKKFKLDEGTTS